MGPHLLAAEGITKSFGKTRANHGIDLVLRGGEVHALLGQNGAGKSTLVGVLTGRVSPDHGAIRVGGETVRLGSPRASAASGIATVFQDLMLIPSMTGLENLAFALGRAANRATRATVERTAAAFELPVLLDVPVSELELPQRQRIELVRALAQQPRFLLLDEPTSLLPPTLVDVFLAKVRELADRGLAILLITHRLDEARSIADCVTVLRNGRIVGSFVKEDLPSNAALAHAMIGTEVGEHSTLSRPSGRSLVEVSNLRIMDEAKHEVVRGVSLHVDQGEILGIAGVDGNGQVELLETLAGLRQVAEGGIRYLGEDISRASYHDRWREGIHFVSGDRQRDGIVPTFSIADHFAFALGDRVRADVPRILQTYDVRPPDPAFRADRLSGGNQQKLLVARACERRASVLLMAYPTHGLDVQATMNVREVLVGQASRGTGVVFTSSDLDELLDISHRVVVMNRGRIVGEQERASFDKPQLAEWFTHGG